MGWRAGCALVHPGRKASSLVVPGRRVGRAPVHMCVCSLSLPLSHVRGENLPPLVQVDEVSGAQEYWNSGAVPGPLGKDKDR